MKLTVAPSCQPSLCWAGPTLLAMGVGENSVRLWDVEKSDNYTLTPSCDSLMNEESPIKVLKVAYSLTHKLLAASLTNGTVAFWQYNPDVASYNSTMCKLYKDSTLEAQASKPNQKSLENAYAVNEMSLAFSRQLDDEQLNGTPESWWQPLPCAILPGIMENNRADDMSAHNLIPHMSWNASEERLALTVSVKPDNDFSQNYRIYLLERQPMYSFFGGNGCVAVQTGPRSLAMLVSRQGMVENPPSNPVLNVMSHGDESAGKASNWRTTSDGDRPTSFIVTSTAITSTDQHAASEYELDGSKSIREYAVQLEDQIRAVFCTSEYLTYWNGHRVFVFKFKFLDTVSYLLSFSCEFRLMGMHKDTLLTMEPYRIQVRNMQGNVKQLISFNETEGSVIFMSQNSEYLVCLTEKQRVKAFQFSDGELKPTFATKSITELVLPTALLSSSQDYTQQTVDVAGAIASASELRVRQVNVNKSGSAVCFSIDVQSMGVVCHTRWPTKYRPMEAGNQFVASSGQVDSPTPSWNSCDSHASGWWPDSRIYIYHVENDRLQFFDLSLHKPDDLLSASSSASIGRWPYRHIWDEFDSRLLVIEARGLPALHPMFEPQAYSPVSQSELSSHILQNDSQVDCPSLSAQSLTPSSRSKTLPTLQPEGKHSPQTQIHLATMIVSLFTSANQSSPVVQENFLMALQHENLIGVEVPYYYFSFRCNFANHIRTSQFRQRQRLRKPGRLMVTNKDDSCPTALNGYPTTGDITNKDASRGGAIPQIIVNHIHRRVMRDFVDLEVTDSGTREAMLSFSYHLTMGEMDAAFKAMKLIQSPTVWQNMARMCVSNCRLDVARICLGKMGDPMAALMVREARSKQPEIEAQAGELALQLDMPDEAERLFIQCGRWDLVLRMHQSLGRWEKALQVANSHNRISLRATHYAYAKELEKMGRKADATEHYIQSDTHRFEVPRMLKDSPELIESFVKCHSDASIQRWWAQTLEAEGRLEEAQTFYTKAKDYLSLVRVLCGLGREGDAERLCNEVGDPAVCYHLARKMEAAGNIEQAIRLFTRAKAYSSAIRLCKENSQNDHLASLAQLGRQEDMLEAANHLENYPEYASKAVLLFQKAGQLGRAVEVAFQTRQFAALQSVTSVMDDRIDPTLLHKCADFFVEHGQYDRAVDALAAGKKYWDALKLCTEYNVLLTEERVEKLTPPQNSTPQSNTTVSESERLSILVQLGELSMLQGNYHMACKKFTQGGSRIAAMKALLRSGDTRKIIFFANVSKQKEIYIMAANYLQTLDNWRSNTDIMRTIIQFYTRGNATESLALFYEACAYAEIEENGNYEKAIGALAEAYKVLVKTINENSSNDTSNLRLKKTLELIKHKVNRCREFVNAQHLFEVNTTEAMKSCQDLLDDNGVDDILRAGDIYATMTKELVKREKFDGALICVEEMWKRIRPSNQSITTYLDKDTFERIYMALNLPLPKIIDVNSRTKKPIDPTGNPIARTDEDDDYNIDPSVNEASDEDY